MGCLHNNALIFSEKSARKFWNLWQIQEKGMCSFIAKKFTFKYRREKTIPRHSNGREFMGMAGSTSIVFSLSRSINLSVQLHTFSFVFIWLDPLIQRGKKKYSPNACQIVSARNDILRWKWIMATSFI